MRTRAALRVAVLLAVLGAGALPARASDPAEDARVREAEALLRRIQPEAVRAAPDALEPALARLVTLHGEIQSASARAALLAGVGGLLGCEEAAVSARLAAADALGRVKDPDGAWKELKRFLPSVKEETAGPVPLRVVQSVGALAPEAALPALLQLMDKAKDANVSRYAIQALGHYGWSKQREKVLKELLDTLARLRPAEGAGGKGRGSGEAARERYAFLRLTLVAALDELTGRKLADAERWLEAAKEHRKRLGELFAFER